MPAILMAVIGVVYASQLVLAGQAESWATALGSEAAFWLSWSVMAWLIFRLCAFLHRVRGPQDWRRYAITLGGGAVAVLVAFPVLFQSILIGAQALGRAWALTDEAPPAYGPAVRGALVNLLGLTAVLYVATVLGWHAVAHYRDSKERKVKAAELESLLHQAQLEALRSQLHPHFLFNTLHAIAELVHENPALAEQLILRLADLLRKVLQSPVRQEVALAEEIDFIKGYLDIEQMRLGERLSVEWDVAPETLTARVPGLLLQPLVENAIQHGIAPLARPGRLSIRARREDGVLHVQVQDTGPGLPTAMSGAPNGHGHGIGLLNTANRLQRLYGERQRFELVNGDGLTVHVRIPFVTETTSPS